MGIRRFPAVKSSLCVYPEYKLSLFQIHPIWRESGIKIIFTLQIRRFPLIQGTIYLHYKFHLILFSSLGVKVEQTSKHLYFHIYNISMISFIYETLIYHYYFFIIKIHF